MKIYTKKGDDGSSFDGESRKSKYNLFFQVVGLSDEVQAHMGLLYVKTNKNNKFLHKLIKNQYEMQAAIFKGVDIPSDWPNLVEVEIDKLEENNKFTGFVLPIFNEANAISHIVRIKVRELERKLILFVDKEMSIEERMPNMRAYVNRLSDYFYALAKSLEGNLIISTI